MHAQDWSKAPVAILPPRAACTGSRLPCHTLWKGAASSFLSCIQALHKAVPCVYCAICVSIKCSEGQAG